jgi:HD superfamily phosphohydrolase
MNLPLPPPLEIRDPIHGAIGVDALELRVIDHPFVQRLRGIRQLGFSHLPFPGATHSRYAHSLGAMHLGGRAFDACFRDDPFPTVERRAALRHCLRLACLTHDLGHAPFSHAAEFAMPKLRDLGLRAYDPAKVAHRLDGRAHHEDYTIGILSQSALTPSIRANFPFGPEHVAALVSPDVTVTDDFFVEGGLDLRGLLSQIVSSDLDVDRMDYLLRDAYYSGAHYGQIDSHWLLSNLGRHVDEEGGVRLALDGRAIYAFDDFMIARFHMFVMVYFHQKSIAYEEMLKRYMQSEDCEYRLPAQMDAYLGTDDAELLAVLRASKNDWARRVVEMRPFRLVREVHGSPGEVDLSAERARVEAAGIPVLSASATGAVFKAEQANKPKIYVVDRPAGGTVRALPLHDATEIFRRYQDQRSIARFYVAEEHLEHARLILGAGR